MTSVLSLWNRSNVGMAALTLTFLRRKNSNGVSSSRHERIPRCVAKDPEEDHQREPGPQVKRWNEDSALRLAGDRAPGESEQAGHAGLKKKRNIAPAASPSQTVAAIARCRTRSVAT